jgi:tetratricopeptide (TPR) repeat protein
MPSRHRWRFWTGRDRLGTNARGQRSGSGTPLLSPCAGQVGLTTQRKNCTRPTRTTCSSRGGSPLARSRSTAGLLGNLANRAAETGHFAEALPHIQEAVALYRDLSVTLPDRHRADLARALSNLSAILSVLGNDDQAAEARREAEQYR